MRAMLTSVLGPVLLAAAFWLCLGACLDAREDPPPAPSRVLVAWDPRACGAPHRIDIALAAVTDDASVERTVPCALGWMALDVPHQGEYEAHVARDPDGESPEPAQTIALTAPIVRWTLDAPP